MKKIFFILFSILLFTSCEDLRTPSSINEEMTNKSNYNYIRIISNDENYDYEKIKLNGHDFFFRRWGTKYGNGSDLVHNPDCIKCKR